MSKKDRQVATRVGQLAPDKYLNDEKVDRLFRFVSKRAAGLSKRAAINRMIVAILIGSGLRANELLDLKLLDCPCCHGTDVIDVRCGKGNISRVVDIDPALSDQIREFVKTYRKKAKPGAVLIPSEAGFRRLEVKKIRRIGGVPTAYYRVERSCRMQYQNLYDKMIRLGENAGIGHLTPHMFRHTFGILLYNVQQDLLYVRDQMGHADIKTTQIYAQTANKKRRAQMKGISPVWKDNNNNIL